MSLTRCLAKHKAELDPADIKAIRKGASRNRANGMSAREAAAVAFQDVLRKAATEYADAGGKINVDALVAEYSYTPPKEKAQPEKKPESAPEEKAEASPAKKEEQSTPEPAQEEKAAKARPLHLIEFTDEYEINGEIEVVSERADKTAKWLKERVTDLRKLKECIAND